MVCKGLSCVTFSIGFASDASPKGIARESCSGYTAPQGFGGLQAAAGPAGPCSQGSLQVTCPPTCPPAPGPGPHQGQLLRSLPCRHGQRLLGILSAGSYLLHIPVGSDTGCDFCSPIQTGPSPEHLGVTKEAPWRASHRALGLTAVIFIYSWLRWVFMPCTSFSLRCLISSFCGSQAPGTLAQKL